MTLGGRSVRGKQLAMVLAVVIVLALLGYVFVQVGPLAPVRVTVATVEQGTVEPAIYGIGTVQARTGWNLGPVASAKVLRVAVDVGERVRAGQLLAEMDPVDFRERLQALDAAVQRAQSAQVAQSAQWQEAQARQRLAQVNARRNEELAAKNFISPSALESRQTELQQADAAVAAAQASREAAVRDVQRLQSERGAALRQRDALRLLAPADALVVARLAEPGSTVVGGQALLQLVDPASLWVRLRVDMGRSSGLAVGLPARVVLRSQPGQTLTGKVLRVEPLADSVTEERIAQVSFGAPASGAVLAVGETAEVTLSLPATASSAVIPNAAVQRQGGQTGVWRMEGGTPAWAPVQLGASSLDGRVQVLQGLLAGDVVVQHSQTALKTGQRVRVVDALVGRSGAP
ncbi:MAG: efflux RND transporter periplasmic adaptor subunit [Rhodoferax sp.]|nr:MAG: efflux RND transporter periplasmic adaptor subunit [Rhodoferax sp.]